MELPALTPRTPTHRKLEVFSSETIDKEVRARYGLGVSSKSSIFMSSREGVWKYVVSDPENYQYANDNVKNDKAFWLHVIKGDPKGWVKEWGPAPPPLPRVVFSKFFPDDPDCLEAAKQADSIITQAIEKEFEDLERKSFSLEDSIFKDNEEAVWKYVALNVENYQYAGRTVKNNKEFWIHVIKGEGWVNAWKRKLGRKLPPLPRVVLSKGFPADQDYVEAARKAGLNITLAIKEAIADPESRSLEYSVFKHDKEAVWKYVALNLENYQYAGRTVKNDKEFWVKVIKGEGWVDAWGPAPPPLPRVILSTGFQCYQECADAARENGIDITPAIVKEIATSRGNLRDSIFKDNEEAVWKYVAINPENHQYAGRTVKNDKEFWIKVIKGEGWVDAWGPAPPPLPHVVLCFWFPDDPDYLEAAREAVAGKTPRLLNMAIDDLCLELRSPEGAILPLDVAFMTALVGKMASVPYAGNVACAAMVWRALRHTPDGALKSVVLATKNIVGWLMRYHFMTGLWRQVDEAIKNDSAFTTELALGVFTDARIEWAAKESVRPIGVVPYVSKVLGSMLGFREWTTAPNEATSAVYLNLLEQCPGFVLSEFLNSVNSFYKVAEGHAAKKQRVEGLQTGLVKPHLFGAWMRTDAIKSALFEAHKDQTARDALVAYYDDPKKQTPLPLVDVALM